MLVEKSPSNSDNLHIHVHLHEQNYFCLTPYLQAIIPKMHLRCSVALRYHESKAWAEGADFPYIFLKSET